MGMNNPYTASLFMRNSILLRSFCVVLAVIGSVEAASASIISISGMNADSDSSELEGSLGGNGSDGTSVLSISTGPATVASTSTFADYTISNVDLDDDSVFAENFSFRITFSSSSGNGVNFIDSREVFGIDGESSDNENFDIGESFTMAFSILSDSSLTDDVVFDGMSELDAVNLSGATVGITSSSGNANITMAGVSTSLGGLFLDPTFTLSTAFSGTIEDWSIQFSTSAIPEPSSALLVGMTALFVCFLRRRKFRIPSV